jgi:hypothetical protein
MPTMSEEQDQSFEQRIRTEGFDISIPAKKWFYVSFVNKPDGKFQGAAVVEGERWGKAIDAVFELKLKPANDNTKCELIIEIPDAKLPPESYRKRRLTREEVEEIWPETKGDSNG